MCKIKLLEDLELQTGLRFRLGSNTNPTPEESEVEDREPVKGQVIKTSSVPEKDELQE
ncbi:uncharacterized protein LOC119610346 isoform X2 [Lucilia sericata]|uniref:uncharacterized protein LOC119610346 isoform X2 n=1 Tax=Lucilia sericata TaxID=13632 RepID=UPI0018A81AAB|nr:uncharacterized protein LOC119610346 isoform X2 [Lucilia sericata]